MPDFRFKALDRDGRFVSGRATGADRREVSERLAGGGHVILEIADGGRDEAGSRRRSPFARRIRPADVGVFLRDLAMVIRAGIQVDAGLRLLAGEEGGAIAAIAEDLRRSISGGASLAEAMTAHPRLFGPDVVTMVRVAEAAGTLDQVLDSVASSRIRAAEALETITGSLRYPAFLLAAAVAVMVFFLVVVVPQFAGVLRDYGPAENGVVGAVLAASDLFVEHGRALAIGAAAVVAVVALVLRDADRRRLAAAAVMRLPGLAGLVAMRRAAAFCDGLAVLLANGVTLPEALAVLADAPGARDGGVARVAESVRRGRRLAEAIESEHLLPPMATDMLRIGEETSELASVARRIADHYESRLASRLRRLSAIVGPVAIVVIAVLIGGLIVSILSALLSIDRLVL